MTRSASRSGMRRRRFPSNRDRSYVSGDLMISEVLISLSRSQLAPGQTNEDLGNHEIARNVTPVAIRWEAASTHAGAGCGSSHQHEIPEPALCALESTGVRPCS